MRLQTYHAYFLIIVQTVIGCRCFSYSDHVSVILTYIVLFVVILALRTYALFNRDRRVGIGFVLLAALEVALSLVRSLSIVNILIPNAYGVSVVTDRQRSGDQATPSS